MAKNEGKRVPHFPLHFLGHLSDVLFSWENEVILVLKRAGDCCKDLLITVFSEFFFHEGGNLVGFPEFHTNFIGQLIIC